MTLLPLWSLYSREVRKFLRGWAFMGAPALVNALMYAGVFAMGGATSDDDGRVFAWMLAGQAPFWCAMNAIVGPTIQIVIDKMHRTIQDVVQAPIPPHHWLVAYIAAGCTAGLLSSLPVALLAIVVNGASGSVPLTLLGVVGQVPLTALGLLVLTGLAFAPIGLLLGVWAEKWDQVGFAFGLVLTPIGFFSGLVAPVSAMPEPLRSIAAASPFAWAIEATRTALVGGPAAAMPTGAVVGALVIMGAVFAFAGWRVLVSGYRLRT